MAIHFAIDGADRHDGSPLNGPVARSRPQRTLLFLPQRVLRHK